MGLNKVISEVNEVLKTQKIGKLSINDEHMLLRMVGTMLHKALLVHRIEEVPDFALDSDANGSIIVRILTPNGDKREIDHRRF